LFPRVPALLTVAGIGVLLCDDLAGRHLGRRGPTCPPQKEQCKLGVGWGPLCEFLGKPVPDVACPKVNEGKDLKLLLRIGMVFTALHGL